MITYAGAMLILLFVSDDLNVLVVYLLLCIVSTLKVVNLIL